MCSSSCTEGMRNRAAALAGRGGRRGCADGDMVAVVQRGAGVSVKSPLLHWLEHLWAQGGREAEDATRHGITPGIFSVAPRSDAASPQLRQSTRAPSPDKSTTGRVTLRVLPGQVIRETLLHLEHLHSAYSCLRSHILPP